MTKYLVYALLDPKTGIPFYVGKSERGLARAKRHALPHEKFNQAKLRKIKRMGKPIIGVLAYCYNKKDLVHQETILIRQLSKIYPLTNMLNNRGRK